MNELEYSVFNLRSFIRNCVNVNVITNYAFQIIIHLSINNLNS